MATGEREITVAYNYPFGVAVFDVSNGKAALKKNQNRKELQQGAQSLAYDAATETFYVPTVSRGEGSDAMRWQPAVLGLLLSEELFRSTCMCVDFLSELPAMVRVRKYRGTQYTASALVPQSSSLGKFHCRRQTAELQGHTFQILLGRYLL